MIEDLKELALYKLLYRDKYVEVHLKDEKIYVVNMGGNIVRSI